jgi:tetratricopeptide (TPR) repeat protein
MIIGLVLSLCTMQQVATAELQFDVARVQKNSCTGLAGVAKVAQKRVAAEAYADVLRYWPDAHPFVEEACYRRAEILRSLGEEGAARGCFEDVLEKAPADSDFYIRALLELGHSCRRNKQYKDSLAYYAQAAAHDKGSLRYQITAQAWLAKLNLALKEYAQAMHEALLWRKRALSSVDYIRASDVYLCALTDSRDWKTAEKELGLLRNKMKKQATAPGKEGEAVAKALSQLKAPKKITLMRQGGR